MSPSQSSAANPHPTAAPAPVAAVPAAQPEVKAKVRARRRVAHLLASGTAGLRQFDRRLEALAARDWSLSALAKELEGVAHEATATLGKRARERLRQIDRLPVDAAAVTLGRSRSAVHALSSALERAAGRVGGETGAEAAAR